MAVIYPLNAGTFTEITIEGRLASQVTLSVLHYYDTGTGTITDGDAFIAAFITALKATNNVLDKYAACCSTQFDFAYLKVQAIKPSRFHATKSNISNLAGTVDDDALPPGTAVAITKRGINGTRGNVGTLHMPGVPVSWIGQGLVSAGAGATAYTALADQLAQPITVMSRVQNPVIYKRSNYANSARVNTAGYELSARTMRRRVVGRGI